LKVQKTFCKALVSAEGCGIAGFASKQATGVRERASFLVGFGATPQDKKTFPSLWNLLT